MTAGRQSVTTDKEWFTPPAFLSSVYEVLGTVDLDPCAGVGSVVRATTSFHLPQDGLSLSWTPYKTVFCNPPYGRDALRGTTIRDWLQRCHTSALEGSEVIALVPVAPNTRHWKEYVFPSCSRICFVGTPRFPFIGGGNKGAPMAVAAVYWGSNDTKFETAFATWGAILRVVSA